MPEIPTIQSCNSATHGSVGSTTSGTVLTGGAANTKGSYVELVASTAFDSTWIMIEIGSRASSNSSLTDIAIGAATEQVIIPDLYSTGKANQVFGPYLFPIFIPKGSRLTARCQTSGAGETQEIVIHLFSGTMLSGGAPPSIVSAYGAVASSLGTAIDPGATANTDSAWTQITAATDREHRWLAVAGRFGDANITTVTRYLLDIGIGSATEQEIVSDIYLTSEATNDYPQMQVVCFPYFVPSGSRLTARMRSSITTAGDRAVNLKIYGC